MRCCESGKKCHCSLAGSGSNCQSGDCCVVDVSSGKSPAYYHSLKCLIRRLVKFFKDFEPLSSSKSGCSKLCCELMCVAKTCEFLKMFFDKGGKDVCGTCKKGGKGISCNASSKGSSKGDCCKGYPSTCSSSSPCPKCDECQQICAAKEFSRALQTLKLSSPCGHELYRTLDAFIQYCREVLGPKANSTVKNAVQTAKAKCGSCSSSGGSCTCSPGSPCLGCEHILQDPQLKVILTQEYVSSAYSSKDALWPDCKTKSQPCCGNSCNSCPSGSSCPPGGCCEKCPKRLCAKIFLGFLPCLYYGLKILYDRCQDPVTWPGWQKISMDYNDNPSSDLAKFLQALGYGLDPLKTKKGFDIFPILGILYGSSGKFKSLSTLVTEKYFTSHLIPPPKDPKTPSTVRELLLWLYGLRFQRHFSDIVENCKSLCLPFGNSFHPDAFCYYIYTCSFILPVSVISFIETSDSAQKVFSSSSEWQNFSYPENPSKLFETFCDFVRKIYIALHFLKFQCERTPGQAGWQDCYFGKSCQTTGTFSSPDSPCCSTADPSSQGYLCTWSSSGYNPNPDVHGKHCGPKGGGKCINANGGKCSESTHNKVGGQPKGSNCNPCPHPLMRFLVDGSSDSDSQSQSQSKSPSSPFRLPFSFARIDFSKTPPVILPSSSDKFLTMGFSPDKLSSTAKSGYSLGHVLKVFCREDGFYPLTRLLQFSLCVSRYPETLGELFAFFFRFSESDVFKNNFAAYVSEEPGTYSGEDLQDAVQGFYGSSHSKSHPFDLRSLIACDGPKGSGTPSPTCGKYLNPLTYNAYDKNIFIENLLGTYLSWVCHLAEKFKEKLEKFHREASEKSLKCCLSSSCKIVECPCALPFLYSYGFTFWSPATLSGGKKCSDFLDQLGKVISGEPFEKLLKEIESFLWSIRKPFFLFILAFWAFVISYFLYVQLYKLDLLHIDSHLHLSRSFKILPSTLFSDASSRLKDLSYFTL
ncbi:variant erythrocyte surface antigen-1 family protein [Babesia divergens]|uniref:Variant erythrocyte surface antigen-1 family protein n=1 Tax=Babesia divergens TaxID=32595 RepID=A0AAD9LGZ7_BABDI|nr:variant erythrocyte surface antigen-1 family protein [Babesia divergens]